MIHGIVGAFVNETNATTMASTIHNATKLVRKLAKCK
jgi:hypothetical protein